MCLALGIIISSCAPLKNGTKSKTDTFEVGDAFKKVYSATQEALQEANNTELKLESIDLSFSTETSISNEIGAKLMVVSGNYSRKKGNTKKVTFTFREDENIGKIMKIDPQIQEFKRYLISVIKSTESIKKFNKFGLSEIEVEIGFTLEKTIDGSIEIVVLKVTPSAKISKTIALAHSITLKFKNK